MPEMVCTFCHATYEGEPPKTMVAWISCCPDCLPPVAPSTEEKG
jgi:hypothetical protein